ncbi:spectrin beta chain, non-erythrocytic 4-like, partial [Malurus melanocephalus]|uniref:spectrin beta chain, non-erythrocytic 4-like n=1 Tax=Malurus melanocephalus TaxID=175006 RepID=UPI002548AD9F
MSQWFQDKGNLEVLLFTIQSELRAGQSQWFQDKGNLEVLLFTIQSELRAGQSQWFQDKGNLEVLLFTIQSELRAGQSKPFVPSDGRSIADINKAWSLLEKAEHERGVALREELIRQEKLELLAQRFDHKAAMRESWLSENQRLVAQDNFGYDLPAVEAAMKKHEAIEADISSYHERIQAVVDLAQEMEAEGYHDVRRVRAQRDNVLRQWTLLTELLRGRRARLRQHLELQKIFQEMVTMMDWMEEMQ